MGGKSKMEFRSCRLADRAKAIRLSRSVFKDNMEKQFIRLFGVDNLAHMFVAVDEGDEVRSFLAYYTTEIQIFSSQVTVASIGSVCTNPSFRGQKLASTLLEMAYQTMRSEGVAVAVISGGGGIYEASGATLVGHVYEIAIENAALPPCSRYQIRPYLKQDLPAMIQLYQAEPLRYVRDDAEFADLLAGQTYSDVSTTYPIDVIEEDGKIVSYAIGVLNDDDKELGWKEYAGSRDALLCVMRQATALHGRERIHFAADPTDPLVSLLTQEPSHIGQYASFRIMDPKRLFSQLTNFAVQRGVTDWSHIVVDSDCVRYRGESLSIASPHIWNQLVFSPLLDQVDWANAPRLKAIWTIVFPLPFPWTHNLNYQ
jgi:predicted N-acetyltransferase YhbS